MTQNEPSAPPKPRPIHHIRRVALLMLGAAALLGWLAAHTDVMFADGLRYLAQARALEQGSATLGVTKAVDHPIYPIAIAAVHRLIGGNSPDAWQLAAQLASVLSGILLVIPLYLISRELFGDSCAVPAVVLTYAVPLTGHVFADTLSESTFLLFWSWGLWGALRFLKTGHPGWVPLVVAGAGLAYLTRPEGLLLPAALGATLVFWPFWVARSLGKRGIIALGVLIVGSAAVVGPYVALKGGIGTKPSIARLLGTTPHSAPSAVERMRPLDPDQTPTKTLVLAARAVGKALGEAVTMPLLALSVVGLFAFVRHPGAGRQWTLLGVIWGASLLALLRLHATGGYCSGRHALVLALCALPSAAAGIALIARRLEGRGLGLSSRWVQAAALGLLVAWSAPEALGPVGEGFDGYRDAGRWIAHQAEDGETGVVVDLTGWSQFYGGIAPGYTFANLVAAPADPEARWVVAREAHMKGPWEYCDRLRRLVTGLEPVIVFRGSAHHRPTNVYVFDRRPLLAGRAGGR